MRFVPRSVMIGFVNALGILIFCAQLPHLIDVWRAGDYSEISIEEVERQTREILGLDQAQVDAFMQDLWDEYLGELNIELAAYFVACGALANVGKYAGASAVTIHVRRVGAVATVEIADDGVGGADVAQGSGLRGLADRVEALDGRLRVVSPLGAGTVVTAELPCAS